MLTSRSRPSPARRSWRAYLVDHVLTSSGRALPARAVITLSLLSAPWALVGICLFRPCSLTWAHGAYGDADRHPGQHEDRQAGDPWGLAGPVTGQRQPGASGVTDRTDPSVRAGSAAAGRTTDSSGQQRTPDVRRTYRSLRLQRLDLGCR